MSDQVTQRIISFYLWILERALFFLLFFLRLRIKRNFRERQQTYLIWPTTDSGLMIKTPCHWPTQIQWLAKEWECTESFTKHPIDTDSRLAWICKRQSSTTHCSFLFKVGRLIIAVIRHETLCKSLIPSCPFINSNEVDETGAYYTEWSKPERKTPIQYTNTYIWNLERW